MLGWKKALTFQHSTFGLRLPGSRSWALGFSSSSLGFPGSSLGVCTSFVLLCFCLARWFGCLVFAYRGAQHHRHGRPSNKRVDRHHDSELPVNGDAETPRLQSESRCILRLSRQILELLAISPKSSGLLRHPSPIPEAINHPSSNPNPETTPTSPGSTNECQTSSTLNLNPTPPKAHALKPKSLPPGQGNAEAPEIEIELHEGKAGILRVY